MEIPLTISDIGLWLAVMSIILLITSELLSSSSTFSRNIAIDKKKLRTLALALGAGFMVNVIIHVFQTI